MGKHTPGPWHRNIKPASKYPVIWAGRNTHVAVLADGARHGGSLPEEEQEANINLIAAAPELLEALSLAADSLAVGDPEREHAYVGEALRKARAAIAKAEGK
jgi:hypothetical protein